MKPESVVLHQKDCRLPKNSTHLPDRSTLVPLDSGRLFITVDTPAKKINYHRVFVNFLNQIKKEFYKMRREMIKRILYYHTCVVSTLWQLLWQMFNNSVTVQCD
jgi:hypothetical protein